MDSRHVFEENRSEEHTSELQSRLHLVCRLLLEKKKCLPPPAPARRVFSHHYLSLIALCRSPPSQSPVPQSPPDHAAIQLCRHNLQSTLLWHTLAATP